VKIPDVDLDVSDRDTVIKLFPEAVIASENAKEQLVTHKTGLYFQQIPKDPATGLAAFPYKMAEDLGYYKIDFIANHVYDLIGSMEELDEILELPVDWSWFTDQRFFDPNDRNHCLTHLGGYLDLCRKYKPKSVEDIAVLIAVIRPAKKGLIGRPWGEIQEEIWKVTAGNYSFKKSHAIAFALLVTVHAKLIAMQLS